VFLGFLKGYPSEMVGDISSGTGFAGLFATGTLLVSKSVGMSSELLFFLEVPTIFIYYFAFKWLVEQKEKYRFVPEEKIAPVEMKSRAHDLSDTTDII